MMRDKVLLPDLNETYSEMTEYYSIQNLRSNINPEAVTSHPS